MADGLDARDGADATGGEGAGARPRSPTNTKTFFISRAGEDRDIALIIDDILREAGYTTFIQDRDFGAVAFIERMDQGFQMVEDGAQIIALVSSVYQTKPHCEVEARYPLIDDPNNTRQRLIVFRIDAAAMPTGFLKPIPYTDLSGLLHYADGLKEAVLGAVDPTANLARASFAALYRRSGQQILHTEIRPVPNFSGRDEELATLDDTLWRQGQSVAIKDATAAIAAFAPPAPANANSSGTSAALSGLGGVGKSVLAQHYAWANRERYAGVWWLRAEKRETLLDDLVTLGARLNAAIADMPDREQAAEITLDTITQAADRPGALPWLMVYDNVETPDDIERLTPANGAHVLITTRWQDWFGHAAEVPLGVFTSEAAVAFLLRQARGSAERPEETRAEAAALADDVGHLPLALAIARAHAWGMNWTLGQYREHLAELIARKPTGAIGYNRELSIEQTIGFALDRAMETCADAETLIGLCAFLAPEQIPLDIIGEDVLAPLAKGEAVAALAAVSLITRETLDDGSAGLSLHRLVQQVVRGRMTAEQAAATAARATELVADAFPFDSDDVRTWPACRRLEAHVLAVLADESQATEAASHLLNQYALHLNARADYAAAEPLYRRALAIWETSLGAEHPQVALGLNNLAGLLWQTNRYAEAEPLFRRALAIDEGINGSDHPDVAMSLNNLAMLLQATNQPAEAEPLYRRALAIWETSLGAEHPQFATGLNNLAELLRTTNRPAEAEPLYRRALDILETSLGTEHPQVASGLNNLAELLRATNRPAEAEPLYRRALAIWETSLGAEHPQVATALNNLAALLDATNRPTEAEPLYRRALAIDEASYGPDHPDVARDLNNLALLLQATNRPAEAEPLARRAAAIMAASLPDHHPWVIMSRDNHAAILAELAGGAAGPVPPADDTANSPAAPATPATPPRKSLWHRLFRRG